MRGALALAYAGLGERELALAEAAAALERSGPAQDPLNGTARLWDLTRVHAQLGNSQEALDALKRLLTIPALVSPSWLEGDPLLVSLRELEEYRDLISLTP